MKTATMKVSDIVPADYNPRVLLKSGDAQFDALAHSIEKFGLVEPLIVNERNNVLVGGHQRLNVLKSIGIDETEVILVDLDEQQEKTLNVALNKIEGDWDFQKLELLIKEIEPEEYSFTGFTESEIENIIGISAEEQETINEITNEDSAESKEHKEPNFDIYLSFSEKEEAERWLRDHDINKLFGEVSRVVTVYMEEEHA